MGQDCGNNSLPSLLHLCQLNGTKKVETSSSCLLGTHVVNWRGWGRGDRAFYQVQGLWICLVHFHPLRAQSWHSSLGLATKPSGLFMRIRVAGWVLALFMTQHSITLLKLHWDVQYNWLFLKITLTSDCMSKMLTWPHVSKYIISHSLSPTGCLNIPSHISAVPEMLKNG